MKTTLFTAIVAFALLFQSCDTKKTADKESNEMDHPKEEMNHDNHAHENGEMQSNAQADMDSSKMMASTVSKEQLESMLSSYFTLKDALVNTNMEEAKQAATDFINDISADFTSLKASVSGMTQKVDVEAIRNDFDEVSATMYQLVKTNADKVDATVYKQYCPMAFNNKGAFWLSQEEAIMNPYFGDKMLKCGKVQEKL